MLYCKQYPENDYNHLVQYLKQNIDFEVNIQLLNDDPSTIKSPSQRKKYYIKNPFFSRANEPSQFGNESIRIAVATNDALFIIYCFVENAIP
jgi:hypothetical protein